MSYLPGGFIEPEFVRPDFKKTDSQGDQLQLANSHRHTLAYGGARSAKSTGFVRNIFLRAMKRVSKHLMVRFRFNHAHLHLGQETVPFVLKTCFPGADITLHSTPGVHWRVPVIGGGESTVWLGGTDNKERMDKLLGSEYSTILLNECSELPFDAVPQLDGRLAEKSGLKLRMYYDCNPTGKKHWSYQLFMKALFPDGEPCLWDTANIQMNPAGNYENLPVEYLAALNMLPKRQRQRFLEGLYLADVEGALWSDQMVNMARASYNSDVGLRKTVIAVDPSVSNNKGSDECGIVVVSEDVDRRGVVRADLSKKMSTRTWAQRVVNAYTTYEANEVVAEVNNGGDLVEQVIHNIDPNIKVVKVHAAVGKRARAEPVSMLYEPRQERVSHVEAFPELESELTETVFEDIKESPNRLDALVWGLSHLMITNRRARIYVR